jgi:phosphatidylserine/phosphatidylglycerophosphate/cardiolipin synthase-like enzyme
MATKPFSGKARIGGKERVWRFGGVLKKSPKAKYRFPWRPGNRFRLLVDGDRFYAAMLESIEAARHCVLLEMYLFESGGVADRFIAALAGAAARGVRVCLLLDGFGALALNRKDRGRLAAAGVELAVYNPLRLGRWHANLFRDHRKMLVADGVVAFTGGAGIADEFDPGLHPDRHWHETMLEARGPVVGDWQALFVEVWNRWAGRPLQLPAPSRAGESGGQRGRVVAQRSFPGRSEVMRSHVSRIRGARRRVWLATAYFVPSWKLRRALRHAAGKGADVRLLLPGPVVDHAAVRHLACRHYESLLRAGVRIFEYQPRFFHAKVLLCDDWVSIGSSNLDRWNYRWNLEANQELADPDLADQVQALFAGDFVHCLEIDYVDWPRRAWSRRLQERVWTWVSAVLAWCTEKRRNRSGPG